MMPLITILCVYVCVKGGGGGEGSCTDNSHNIHMYISRLYL